jgi:hypothetical protein
VSTNSTTLSCWMPNVQERSTLRGFILRHRWRNRRMPDVWSQWGAGPTGTMIWDIVRNPPHEPRVTTTNLFANFAAVLCLRLGEDLPRADRQPTPYQRTYTFPMTLQVGRRHVSRRSPVFGTKTAPCRAVPARESAPCRRTSAALRRGFGPPFRP